VRWCFGPGRRVSLGRSPRSPPSSTYCRRGGRGGARSDGDKPRRGRQFDRKDGTGRAHENKKGGAGKGNWGSSEQEAHEVRLVCLRLEYTKFVSPTERIISPFQ